MISNSNQLVVGPARVRSRHPVSSPLMFSGWYRSANAPNPNRPSSAPGASGTWALPGLIQPARDASAVAGRLRSVQSFLQHLTSVLVGLSRLFGNFIALPHCVRSFPSLAGSRPQLVVP